MTTPRQRLLARIRRRPREAEVDVPVVDAYRPYFAGQGRVMVGMSIASFLAGLTEAALLVVVARLAFSLSGTSTTAGVDPGSISGFKLSIAAMFWLSLGLGIARLVLQVLAAHLTALMTSAMIVRMRAGTYDDYVRASWAVQADEEEAAVQDLLVRYVNRVTSAVTIMASGLSVACSLVALLLGAVLVDPLSAGLIVVTGGVLFFALKPISAMAKRMAKVQAEAGRNYATRSMEAIELSLEIRSFGVSDNMADRLRVATAAEVRPIYFSNLFNKLVSAIYQMAAILILLGGLFAVYSFLNRPLASLAAIVVILVRALNQSGTMQSAYHSMVEVVPFAARLTSERERFRDSVPPSGADRLEHASSLAFDHVSYAYVTGRPALEDVSFEISAGEAVGLIGPSGSGKSTLIQLLLRLRRPDVGTYLVGGFDAAEINDDSWFSEIAFVPQDCRVFNATVGENICFFRDNVTQADIEEAAHRAHIHDEIMAMPDGYETQLGSRGGALSGGQRQRVAIARALVRRPSILVLDEPTSALDLRSESLVHETLNRLKGSVTLVVIAHRLSTLNTCDRIMVMGDGRLQAFGDRVELQDSSSFYRDALERSRIRS